MAASSSSSHVSISIPAVGGHDVFLSFRGKDTRDSFTSHLYAALCRKSIKTFIDSEGLRSGDEISPSLLETIEGSRVVVIIFSEHYASSKWCLEELAKILHCKKTTGQLVIPVFHDVDPSVIRYQIGSFKKAFDKHEVREQRDKVQSWRASLIEASNLSGWDSRVTRPESELVDNIVEDVLNKLGHKSLTSFHGLVGIDLRIKKVESLLCLDSMDVRSVGIWGMGGIGKTTIAKAVFDHLYSQFEGFYFLENVKEELERYGKVSLVNNFLSKVLDEKGAQMGSLSLAFTRERLCRKRILVVLDDVDDSTVVQLGDLAMHHDLFGPGSKVLLTSRNVHVLKNFEVDEIYEVDALNQDEGLRLFVFNAFKNVCLTHDYLEQSKRVVHYTKGHPLAIKVLGSTLLDRSQEDWVTILDKLKKFPKPSIMDILRISYDELSDEEKNIFLDIAFFFKGNNQDYVKRILDGCYDFVHLSITHLVEKALITIGKNDKIKMHDLIREMSLWIVRQECDKDPGRRSRLLDPNDVYNVLTKKKGTDAIEGIILDVSQSRNMRLKADAFASMTELRILKFYNCEEDKIQLPSCGLEYLSDELRFLHWERFPSKSLASSFCGEYIVELQMRKSKVERLWTGTQDLGNLKLLDLRESKNLTEIPDLSKAKNIERIDLYSCGNLVTIHSSVQYLPKLQKLFLNFCEKLENVPGRLESKCLKTLGLSRCPIQKFPDLSCDSLESLWLNEGCPFREVPPLQNFKHLQELCVTNCSDMTKFPEISNCITLDSLTLTGTAIEEIPSSIQSLTSLTWLDLSDNKYLSSLPTTICKLTSLLTLRLRNCSKLEEFPEMFKGPYSLDLSGCKNLKRLPTHISNVESLGELDLSNCKLIGFVPKLLKSAWKLDVNNCESLETLLSSDIHYLKECFFLNCYRLDEKTREKLMAFAESRKKMDVFSNIQVLIPGSEIPKWLDYQSSGSSVTVPLPLKYNHVMGMTFCIVYTFTSPSEEHRRKGIKARFKWYAKGNAPVQRQSSPIYRGESDHFDLPNYATKSDHLMLYRPGYFREFRAEDVLSGCSALSFEFSSEVGDDVLVKECAVHPYFAEDSDGQDQRDFWAL